MNLFRRDFLRLGLLTTFMGGLSRKAFGRVAPQLNARTGLSILQGATDDSRTQFSIVHAKGVSPKVYVMNSADQSIAADKVETKTFTNMNTEVTRAFFSGLRPGQDYILHVDDAKNSMLDMRIFQTLDLSKGKVSFAMCSCMDDTNHDPGIWQDLVKHQPDVIFFLGDSVYTDQDGLNLIPTPDRLWRRFSEARQKLEIYYSTRLVPIIATWDDHDFGGNDSTSSYKYVSESQKNFLTFFAQEPSHCSILERGPGVSCALKLAGQLFLLMDDRSYRLRQGSKDRYAHWGQAQEQWALGLMQKQQGPTWFFNGTQIFPQMFFKESVSGDHKVQFDGFLKALKKINSKVVFGSGDVHFSEVSQIEKSAIGYPTYELTSSSVHSASIPGVPDIIPNNRRIYGTGNKNYLMVDAVAKGMGVQMTVISRSRQAKENFKANLSI